MAQKLLDRTQIAPRIQQMRGKAVAQCVGCGAGRQAKLHPCIRHHLRYCPRCQRPTAHCAKQRRIPFLPKGADAQIGIHGIARRREHGHHPFLTALTDDTQHLGQGRVGPLEAKRFGYPQPAPPQQGQDRHIPRGHPGVTRLHFHAVDHRLSGINRQGAGQLFGKLRRSGRQHGGRLEPLALCQPAIERLDRRQLARHRPWPDIPAAGLRHPGAHVRDGDL